MLPGQLADIVYGQPIGVVKDDQFSFHFLKRGRNMWRPEFRGSLSAEADHVIVTIVCGLSNTARFVTTMYLSVMAVAFVTALWLFTNGQTRGGNVVIAAMMLVFSIAVPWRAFAREYSQDLAQLKSLFDGLERQKGEINSSERP